MATAGEVVLWLLLVVVFFLGTAVAVYACVGGVPKTEETTVVIEDTDPATGTTSVRLATIPSIKAATPLQWPKNRPARPAAVGACAASERVVLVPETLTMPVLGGAPRR